MILPTMSYAEAAAAADREVGTCRKKILDVLTRFGSHVKRLGLRTAYPYSRTYTVLSRDRTQVFVTCTATRRSDWDNPHMQIFVPFHMQRGLFCASIPTQKGSVILYTDHFFSRYRERILGDGEMGALDVVKTFFERNADIVLSFDVEKFSNAYAKYESDEIPPVAARVAEGNCFGEFLNPKVLLLRTIISDGMLHPGQDAAFGSLEEERKVFASVKHEPLPDRLRKKLRKKP